MTKNLGLAGAALLLACTAEPQSGAAVAMAVIAALRAVGRRASRPS